MSRDSIGNTFGVAAGVCGVCALLVSVAAVGLKSTQDYWVKIDTQKNILFASAADTEERTKFGKMSGAEIDEFFKANFEDIIVDLETGQDVTSEYPVPAEFRQIEVAELKKADAYTDIPSAEDVAKIKRRENHSHVYIRKDATVRYIFPIRGKGLWSTLKGFIALQPDLKTVAYLTFYEHKETPGLGGEVDNLSWKQQWEGKVVYNTAGDVAIQVVKGSAGNKFQIDGLSGATITSRGVQNMLTYWMGPEGFGQYIKSQKKTTSALASN